MNIEQTWSIESRAAVHAALGDPTRLRIVDMLALGDRSPRELQSEFDMPSNLMAHHLLALERAGLLSRHRSEADRRRTYLRLERVRLDLPFPGAATVAPRVLFVCTANSARSHLAEALWRNASDVPSASAGTHPADRIASGARTAARRHGLALDDATPRRLSEVARPDDLVITVCDRAHEELGGGGLHWSVPDPVALGTQKAFDDAFASLAERVNSLAPRVTAA